MKHLRVGEGFSKRKNIPLISSRSGRLVEGMSNAVIQLKQ